ncbi:MAG: hypothetical protein KAY12_03620 [Arenimonas sp.]|nr:hypothetical protein [Arenimonas sp.]
MASEFPPVTLHSRTAVLASLWTLAALLPLQVQADSSPDQWQWRGTVYAWLPSLGGETSFPPGGDGPSIDISADQIISSLNFAFMGSLEGRKGPWGVATDVIYLDLGGSEKATRDFGIGRVELPASVNANLRLDVTGWVWTLAGSYAAVQQQQFTMDVLAGARMLDLEEGLRWSVNGDVSSLPLPGRSGSSNVKDTAWDAIVGLKGRATFGTDRNWSVPFYVDAGAGDSNLTWQGVVGLAYAFDSVDVTAAWRYLDYDLGSHAPIQSINFNGPALGVTFRF